MTAPRQRSAVGVPGGSPGCHFVTAPMAGPGRRQSHQPLVFALLVISSHKPDKTASGTTSSRAKRRGVAEVTIARGRLRREMQDPTGMGPRLRSCCCHGASRRSRAPLRVRDCAITAPRERPHFAHWCRPGSTVCVEGLPFQEHQLRNRCCGGRESRFATRPRQLHQLHSIMFMPPQRPGP